MPPPAAQRSSHGSGREAAPLSRARRNASALVRVGAALAIGLATAACAQGITSPEQPAPATGIENRALVESLRTVLDGEYAATYAYGVIGGQLTAQPDQQSALKDLDAHAKARDRVRTELIALGEEPQPPAPAYSLPSPVRSPAEARALAADVETRLALRWRAVAEAPTGSHLEEWARQSEAACERRAARWAPKSSSSAKQ